METKTITDKNLTITIPLLLLIIFSLFPLLQAKLGTIFASETTEIIFFLSLVIIAMLMIPFIVLKGIKK